MPFQPGTANARAGAREHPFVIRFDLSRPPTGTYTLKVALLAYSPRLPWLDISINGHRAWLYQQPRLAYSAGDQAVFYLPYYSTAEIECEVPTDFLVRGSNNLVLVARDPEGARDDSQPSGFPWPGTSGIVYDAVALEHADHSGHPAGAIGSTVQPTIYYIRKNGELLESVDVFLRFRGRPHKAQATLSFGSRHFSRAIETEREFGELHLQFDIPETALTGPGEITVDWDGSTSRFPSLAKPAKKWTIFVAPNVHVDVGYSDSDSKVAEIHSRTVDESMDMIARYPEFRFNPDASWAVDQFLRGRSEEEGTRFVAAVRENKISIPAAYTSAFTGFQSVENLIRSLYFSKDFARRNHTPFDFSLINDVPSYSWSYASVMASAGLKYFVAASDAYRGPFLLINRFNELSPQWWEGPDGQRVLTWYSRHYHQMASMFGLPPQVAIGHDALPRFLQMFARPEYRSDAVLLFGTQVENTDLFPQQAALAEEWNKVYAYPKLQYAGFAEAMSHIAAQTNSLNWKRSELVETDLDNGVVPVDLVTNREVPVQVLSIGHSYRHVRFLAEDVPGVGYKCFALRPPARPTEPPSASIGEVIESPYYRLTFDTTSGAVRSIWDKELRRELVDSASPFRFDQYLYVTGADDLPNRLVQYSTVSPEPKLEIHPAGAGRLLSITRVPYGTVARIESSAINTPRVETEIVLFDGQKKIEFINHIRKTKVYSKEAAYFAFPLAMSAPRFRYETQNGFVDPGRDLLPGAGLEWFNVQHWVAAEQNGMTAVIVPVDAPMITLGDIARGRWPKEFGSRNGTVFSYIMSNYTPEGYPAGQGGDFTFRYVLSSASRFDPAEAGRLGWAAMSPFEIDEIRPNDKAVFVPRPLSAAQGSFFEMDQPDLALVTWKLAEDGNGTILRFLETGGQHASVRARVPRVEIKSAWRCNAVEDNQQPLEISAHELRFAVKPHEIATIRIEPTAARTQ